MKIRQNVRHFAARKALETPVVRDVTRDKLVDLHTRVFLERAPQEQREERRCRLEAFFEGTIDAYLAALQEGYSEAEAREITHVMGNLEFYRLGWTEMMEFPANEVDDHIERHSDFLASHDVSLEDPLGEFGSDSLPEAPATPEKLSDPDHPYAEGGFSDDVYVEDREGVRRGGKPMHSDVEVRDAAGVDG